MAETAGLADAFLESCPALQWITDTTGAFQRIYGDPAPLFGESAAQLLGRRPDQVWVDRFARALAGETLYFRERVREFRELQRRDRMAAIEPYDSIALCQRIEADDLFPLLLHPGRIEQ